MVSTRHHPLEYSDGTAYDPIDLDNIPYSSPYKDAKKEVAEQKAAAEWKAARKAAATKKKGAKGKGIRKEKRMGVKKGGKGKVRGKRKTAKERAQEKAANAKRQPMITDLLEKPKVGGGGSGGGDDEDEKPINCPHCGKVYNADKLKAHQKGCRKRGRDEEDEEDEEDVEDDEGDDEGGNRKRVKCEKCGELTSKEQLRAHTVKCQGREDGKDEDENPKSAPGNKGGAESVTKKNVVNCPHCGKAYYAHKLAANLKRCKKIEHKLHDEEGEDQKPLETYNGKRVKCEKCGRWITKGKMEVRLERCKGSGKDATPHNLATLKRATETLLKHVAHWSEVLNNSLQETRGALPVAQTKNQGARNKGEAYLMWTTLMSKVKEAGSGCTFTQLTYIDRATSDGELAAAEARTQKLEEELGNVGDGKEIGEEKIKKAIPEGGISREELLGLFRERIGRERGGVRAFWKRVAKVAEDVGKDGMLRLKNLRDRGGRTKEDGKDDEDEDEDNPGRGKPGAGGTVITTADDDADLAFV